MGTKDIETAVFFDDDKRYADLLNGYIFAGKQVVAENQLYSQDTRENDFLIGWRKAKWRVKSRE